MFDTTNEPGLHSDGDGAHVRNHQSRDGGTNKLRAVSGGRVEMRSVTHGKLAHIGVVGMRLVGENHQYKAQRPPANPH